MNRNSQHGATLIVVMGILVVIVMIGTWAIRSGILGLKLATNSQVQALLLENSNAALFNLEDPNQVARQLAQDGMYSYFNSAANADDELVFCYKAKNESFFALNQASAIEPNGSTSKIGVTGFCKATQFSGGRSAVLSQVYLKKNRQASLPFADVPEGTSLGSSLTPSISQNISAMVISILPAFADASGSEIQECFKKRSNEVKECFSELNIPYNVQYADYIVGGQPELIS